MLVTTAPVRPVIEATILDSLLISTLSPTIKSSVKNVFTPTISLQADVTDAVPRMREFAESIRRIYPFAATDDTVAAASCPYVPNGFAPKTISSPTL